MKYQKLLYFLQNVGKNPSALIFEDELTGLNNRRFLFHHCQNEIDWNDLDTCPVCLLMVNIDYFKRINTKFGHNTGDQVLVHVAETIRTAVPANSIVARYAGDNFLVLLNGLQKDKTHAIARKLLDQIRTQPFAVPETGQRVPLSLSAGIACAPENASNIKSLIHKADAAMSAARQAGRDRCMDAGDVSDSSVFPKTALQYLESAGLAGRGDQLARIRESLRHFSQGKNRMIIIDGAPGIGKTRFLSTIEKDLKSHFKPIRVQGEIKEAFRPYYMAAYIAMSMMNRLEDKGLSILEQADEEEIDRLAQIIPQIRETDPPLPENDPEQREAVFSSFTDFITSLAGDSPLILLIDDLHYSDPASLHLIRMLIENGRVPVFLCGTASREKQTIGESVALDLFRDAYSEELDIQSISLTPLTESDIETYLDAIFTGIRLPRGLCREMARVTRGNPLFLREIIRKMINDGNIRKEDSKWVVPSPDKEYFPRSLEEIIRLKMNSLDEDSRRFLDQASAFGESTFLSMLAGITRDYSSRLYEIINNAEEQGIVQAEFDANDENIRFSSKQIRDIIYDGINPEEKKLLHQQIGIYQESLFQQDLLPSAAFLAHHFSRSDEIEKARDYKSLQDARNQLLFREQEITGTAEAIDGDDQEQIQKDIKEARGLGGDTSLSPQAEQLVPHMLRALLVAVRNTRLYPAGSKSVTSASRDLLRILERIFYTNDQVSITLENEELWINGKKLDTAALTGIAANLKNLFSHMEIKSLLLRYGLGEDELQSVLDELSKAGRKVIKPDFWKSFAEKKELDCIQVLQVTYSRVDKPDEKLPSDPDAGDLAQNDPGSDMTLFESRPDRAHRIIGAVLGTYSKFRLYPAGGPVTAKAVNQLIKELQAVLSKQPVLIVSRVKNTLLFDGAKVDTTGAEALCSGMVRLMAHTSIGSLTFTRQITENDLESFFRACFETSEDENKQDFWLQFNQTRNLSGLLVNQRIYDEQQIHFLGAGREPESCHRSSDHEIQDGFESENSQIPLDKETDEQAAELSDQEDRDFASRLRDLFLKGQHNRITAILQQLAGLYESSDQNEKTKIFNRFYAALDPPGWQPSAAYLKLVLNVMMPLFDTESNAGIVNQAADHLHKCASAMILYDDYPAAAWIFARLNDHRILAIPEGMEAFDRLRAFGRDLDPAIVDVLWADIKSSDSDRRRQACDIISTLGKGAIPMLIDLIRHEEDIRIRRTAAGMLGHTGKTGAQQLKQALIEEGRDSTKLRILEVIDSVTTEIGTELRYILIDSREPVRQAALRLIQRIDKPETTSLLADLALSRDAELAVESINHLGSRKSEQAANALLELSSRIPAPDVLCALCRAMGQHADPRFLAPLEKILFPPRRLLKKNQHSSRVRIAAVYALSRIQTEQTKQMIAALKNDKDPRVREAALLLG
jgi:diguanylate cyclase (GGDEF)-like protein